MNLSTLKKFAAFLNQTPYLKLRFIKRIGDNLFKLDIGGEIFYFDLSRGRSMIFMAEDSLVGHKIYNAPFDKSLQKFCWNSWIKQAKTDGNNRIVQLFLELQSSYKTSEVILNVEFTGRNTNLILLDTRQIVLDALRHITSKQSFR